MRTAIRMDDITPDMDFEKFNRVKKIMDTYQIKPLIGVVPFNQDSNLAKNAVREDFPGFLRLLKEEGYVIALHGCYHKYTTNRKGLFPLNNFSEFAGVSYKQQKEMVAKGKMQLNEWGIDTDIFMAPAHTFDRNTLKALKTNGFRAVTDGFGTKPYLKCDLVFYPIAAKRSDCFSDREGFSTLVLHSNMMDENDFLILENQIKNYHEKFISYNEYMRIEPIKRGFIGHVREYGMAYAKFILVRLRESLEKE